MREEEKAWWMARAAGIQDALDGRPFSPLPFGFEGYRIGYEEVKRSSRLVLQTLGMEDTTRKKDQY